MNKQGLSKALSVSFVAAVAVMAVACSPLKARENLEIAPGAEGTIVAIGSGVSGVVAQNELSFEFDRGVAKNLTIGVATSGPYPQFKGEAKLFAPASTTKIVTTSLALKMFGPDFVFKTLVGYDDRTPGVAHDLILLANGDPQPDFTKLAEELKTRQISRLDGDLTLVSEDVRHDDSTPARGMSESDYGTCYAAVSQSFNVGHNCSSGHAIADAKQLYAEKLKSVLGVAGIDASSVVVKAPGAIESQAALQMAAQNSASAFTSAPLKDIVRLTNKPSDNFFADAIFKTIASQHGASRDLRTEGQLAFREAIKQWLTQAGHPEYENEIRLIDGAGLSRENQVSARAYMTVLGELTKEPTFPALWNSLPIAGRDGTLKNRMRGSAAEGVVRAKTGTLHGSYQLAGYIPKFNEDRSKIVSFVPFVILSSVNPADRFDVFKFQAQLASKLLALVNPDQPKNALKN